MDKKPHDLVRFNFLINQLDSIHGELVELLKECINMDIKKTNIGTIIQNEDGDYFLKRSKKNIQSLNELSKDDLIILIDYFMEYEHQYLMDTLKENV